MPTIPAAGLALNRANGWETDMRVIIALCAAVVLAACAQGNWDANRTTYSFSFDSGLSAPVKSRAAEPLATPPVMFDGRGLLAQEALGTVGNDQGN